MNNLNKLIENNTVLVPINGLKMKLINYKYSILYFNKYEKQGCFQILILWLKLMFYNKVMLLLTCNVIFKTKIYIL